jgi:hypothetical protein
MVNGYHVLTLVINATEPCNMTFNIYDQIKIREKMNFEDIDNEMLRLTNVLWKGNYDHIEQDGTRKNKKFNTESAIWKLQRKI